MTVSHIKLSKLIRNWFQFTKRSPSGCSIWFLTSFRANLTTKLRANLSSLPNLIPSCLHNPFPDSLARVALGVAPQRLGSAPKACLPPQLVQRAPCSAHSKSDADAKHNKQITSIKFATSNALRFLIKGDKEYSNLYYGPEQLFQTYQCRVFALCLDAVTRNDWRSKFLHDSVKLAIGAESVTVTTKCLARNSRASDRKYFNTVFGVIPVATCCFQVVFWPLVRRLGSP